MSGANSLVSLRMMSSHTSAAWYLDHRHLEVVGSLDRRLVVESNKRGQLLRDGHYTEEPESK